jgi:hypothetical protein
MPNVRPIPDFFRSVNNHRLAVVERGEKCYLVIDLDNSKTPFKVYERVIQDNGRELVETLHNNQAYQGFKYRWDADLHYERVERGLAPIRLANSYVDKPEGNECE